MYINIDISKFIVAEEEQRFENPHRHYLDMTPKYYELKMDLLSKTREAHA